ncbi:MAG TPA: deoxyguanosinetriphosphate triphosphohydrolase [Candidatus Eisenbacteria bacterium]|nr:deoxyguanosinetriphosphate triphosphohydrolase [Candidatus Eisenbacteria bacterium]
MTRPGGASAYDEQATTRWVDEPPKRPGRSAFERDRARVLHSAALRRLAAKTQVVVPWESDFPRTRLTHALECAQVGRELGKALGCDPDLVDAAGLAHDLGHPPFGHTGEAALDAVARGCGGFEGNAQSLRILTRLEAKAFAADGRSAGLNLTRATLDAACKYPWRRAADRPKFGVYDEDLEVFAWLRAGAPEGRRCLEAQVMDWSDDVAYSVHDLEDALYAGHLRLDHLTDASERAGLLALTAERCADASPDEVGEALDRLLGLPYWPRSFDGSRRALAALKNATSQLIGRFCQGAERATREAFGGGPLSRYAADLVVPREVRLECEVLKAVAARYVMDSSPAAERYRAQRRLVHELVEALVAAGPDELDPTLRPDYERAGDDAGRLRVVLDHVASLTDTSAVATHRRLGAG